jgi:hypothetical protein
MAGKLDLPGGPRFLKTIGWSKPTSTAFFADSSLREMQRVGKLAAIDTGTSVRFFVVSIRRHDDPCLICG